MPPDEAARPLELPLPPALPLERVAGGLVAAAGSYLHNTVREPRVTCAVCAIPCRGHLLCGPCLAQRREPGLRADQVAMLLYGVAGSRSGYLMRGYKAQPLPVAEDCQLVSRIAMLGLGWHTGCAANAPGRAVTHWAVVPSLPARQGEHPLRRLVAPAASGSEVTVAGAAMVTDPREISRAHFSASCLPPDSHVLLIDDTWATGGHAQSAVLALRDAGATAVSVLVVARWLLPGFGENRAFLRERASADYDPRRCPWTAGGCP